MIEEKMKIQKYAIKKTNSQTSFNRIKFEKIIKYLLLYKIDILFLINNNRYASSKTIISDFQN